VAPPQPRDRIRRARAVVLPAFLQRRAIAVVATKEAQDVHSPHQESDRDARRAGLLVAFVLTRGGDATLVEQPLLAGFDSATVTRLQLFGESPSPRSSLVKRGADWVLASHF
jgi:hypothetical protein